MTTFQNLRQRCRHWVFAFYLVSIFLILLGYGMMNIRHTSGSSWALGDWLINYEGGFVRRGLMGEVVFLVGKILHVPLLYLILFLQLGCYGVILGTLWILLASSEWPLWLVALVVSPATLAFPIVDSQAGFRKEILYFAGLSVLLLMLRRQWQNTWAISLYLSIIVVISTMSHEGLLCFLPYYLAALSIGLRNSRLALKTFIVPAAIGLMTGYIVSRYPGNTDVAARICSSLPESLQAHGSDICSGAIRSLGDNPQNARAKVVLVDHSYAVYRLYAILTALAVLPIIAGSVDLRKDTGSRRGVCSVMAALGISFPGSLILFVYADDWGRWIYIHLFSLSLLLFFLESRRRAYSNERRREPRLPNDPKATLLVWALLGIYATAWNLPHVPTYKFHSGYFGLYRHFKEFRAK